MSIWAEGEWSGAPFVSDHSSIEHRSQAEQPRLRNADDIAKLGYETIKRTTIPNEGGEFDRVEDTASFVSHRADLPA